MMTRSIESYVMDICKFFDARDYESLITVYETLQRMKTSSKEKHNLNYWKVLQCTGEVAADKLVLIIVKNNKISCKCYAFTNLMYSLQLFAECLTTVAVIKRINHYKNKLIPVIFCGLEQQEDPGLTRKSLIVLYRLLVVGKTDFSVMYMKSAIVRHCCLQIKCRQGHLGVYPIQAVQYCAKILAAIAQLGNKSTRQAIIKSNAVIELNVYITKLEKENFLEREGVEELLKFNEQLHMLLSEKTLAEAIHVEDWSSKEKLREELGQSHEIYIFCSSSNCRRPQNENEKFRYCGECRLARYCSEDCQRFHWRASHKEQCLGRIP